MSLLNSTDPAADPGWFLGGVDLIKLPWRIYRGALWWGGGVCVVWWEGEGLVDTFPALVSLQWEILGLNLGYRVYPKYSQPLTLYLISIRPFYYL